MRRHLARSFRILAAPLLLAIWLIAVPSASAGNPCFHGYEIPAPTTESTTQIKLADCAFGPTIARVPVGATVTFFNGPNFTHLITGASQAWGSPDVEVQPMTQTSYRFDTAGIYPYACALHPGMAGAIVVGDPAQAAADTSDGGATTAVGGGDDVAQAAAASNTSGAIGMLAAVGAGTIAGVIAGAGAVWLVVRRRTTRTQPMLPTS